MSAAATVQAALLTALESLFPAPIGVYDGPPPKDIPDDVVAITDVSTTWELAALDRSQREVLDVTVTFSSFRPEATFATVTAQIASMVGDYRDWLFANPSISGTAQGCDLSVPGDIAKDLFAQGAVAEVQTTLRVFVAV